MATFNPDRDLLGAQIESIRGQDAEDWVCLVGDDGSEPAALDAIRELIGADPRFVVHAFERRLGVYRNFERLLGLVPAEVELVAFCDQDDRWHPDKLSTLAAAIRPGVALAYSDMRIVDESGAVLAATYWTRRRNNSTDLLSLLIANTVTGAATAFRRELLGHALPFPAEQPGSFHDRWLALVALAEGDLAYVDRPLLDYVQHEGAALGHARANRGGAPRRGAGEWREAAARLRSGELARRWQQAYLDVCVRVGIEARTLEERCGGSMSEPKARAVRRLARAERNPLAVPWLELRSLRRHLGRDETMGVERGLARGYAWRQLTAVRRRLSRPRRPAPPR